MSKNKFTIEHLYELAQSNNGKCLSSVYKTLTDNYLWECNEGHVFEKKSSHIKRGQWCPYCSGIIKGNMYQMKHLAQQNNGECLSSTYVNDKTKLVWSCHKGHIFESSPNKVKQGRWCPQCSNQNRDILDIQKIAEEKRGKLLSSTYTNRRMPLNWECENGHLFTKPLAYVLDGSWCPECYEVNKKAVPRKRWNIDSVKAKMKELGGECLQDRYKDNKTKMKFRCEHGHEWTGRWDQITNGRWCPICAGNMKKSIEDMKELASKFDGECLSEAYEGANNKLTWRCKEGHTFQKTYRDIVDVNSWCPTCSGNIPKTIEEMKKIAESHKGECLSNVYINNKEPLLWQCEKGHQWKAPARRIYLEGTWCHECRKLGIESMKQIASERKGKCLSEEYIDVHTHLEWECKKGHLWMATPSNIKRGTWCPTCSRNKQ